MGTGKKKQFEEEYQKAYKAYQDCFNGLPIEVKEQTVDMLDRISENAIAISEVERALNNLKSRQKQLKQELIYWYKRKITKE